MKKKKRQLKQLKEFAKNYQMPLMKNASRSNLLSDKDGIKLVTENACIRPDIFLDNGRYCDGCPYWDGCECKIKRLSKSYRA
jgi:hypothetical protein